MVWHPKYSLSKVSKFDELSDFDKGWIVGFLEGEGSFVLHVTGNERQYSYPRIQVAQVQKEPIERLQRLLGGASHLRSKREPTHARCWMWYLTTDAGPTMRSMQEHFSPKRQKQIQIALRGERRGYPLRKLTPESVRAIRDSDEHRMDLAERYGVSPSLIWMVQKRQIWKHVD